MNEIRSILDAIQTRWPKLHVVVVGDVMLDSYVWGDVERISPEAPVPIVQASRRSSQAGGAANVAANLAGLGLQCTVVGCVGDDAEGQALEAQLGSANIRTKMLTVAGIPTTHKLRVISGHQQMMRIDLEQSAGFVEETYPKLFDAFSSVAANADAVILSDYAKGVLSPTLCQQIIQQCRSRSVPVLVDPKGRDFAKYRGATTICPNLSELALALGESSRDSNLLFPAAQKQIAGLALNHWTVTMSDKGIALLYPDKAQHFPTRARQVFDVSGAGDTVIATLAAAMSSGLSAADSAELANVAAGIVVGKVGTVPIQQHELISSLSSQLQTHFAEKILSRGELAGRVEGWRSSGETVVFTNGCFDLLHVGHITLLEEAKRMGDRLIVAINSDRSVSKLKGESRPLVGERERARLLAALASVDAVTIFDEPTPLECIVAFRPNVLVKGGDYKEDTVVGAPEVRSWNGRVAIVPTVPGFSTTNLIAKMNSQ